MRKTPFLLAVVATVMLVACQREIEINTPVAGENEVTFILQGAPSTKATDGVAEVTSVSIPVQVEGSDEYFCLEETIEDLNAAYAPVTRGTPAAGVITIIIIMTRGRMKLRPWIFICACLRT